MAKKFAVKIKNVLPGKKTLSKKIVSEVAGLSLRKAKELIETRGIVAEKLSKRKAIEIKKKLQAAGAIVEVLPAEEARAETKIVIRAIDFNGLNDLLGKKLVSDTDIKHLRDEKNIKTLEDIRRRGGLRDVEEVNEQTRQKLEAHAYISLLSDNALINEKLINAGFATIPDIAETSRSGFLRAADEAGISREAALAIHRKAAAASAVFTNALTQARVEQANGFAMQPQFDIEDVSPIPCACPDNESAVSPIAYLADLLRYICQHVEIKNSDSEFDSVGLADLERLFFQPFGELPASGEEVDRKVRQVRVCIEVLRRFLKGMIISIYQQNILAEKEKSYAFEAYKCLLNQIGTSYDELRLAKTGEPEKCKALADRLGIDLDEQSAENELDELLLVPDTISEQVLERLFGLTDTKRDPLCDGLKLGDDEEQPQLIQWKFNGVQWNRNTGENGNLYISIKKVIDPNGAACAVSIFRDPARTQLVAFGRARLEPRSQVRLTERNDSALSGQLEVQYKEDSENIQISVLPNFLAWRLKHLRTLWNQQDWPTDPYSENLLPVIDPDVIGPEDIRDPQFDQPSSSFGLWLKRRDWADKELQAMADLKKTIAFENGVEVKVPDIQALFNRMYKPVSYRFGHSLVVPWRKIQPEDFDLLRNQLEQGKPEEVSEAQKHILKDLNLSLESFLRLLELVDKSTNYENDIENEEPVTADEWEEVYSILLQAQKVALQPLWCKEEAKLDDELEYTLFGPQYFWISLREPKEGIWSPSLHNLRPLIDPEVIKLEDLATEPIGSTPRALWNQRRDLLVEDAKNIRLAYEEADENKLEAALTEALEQPPDSLTWVEIVDQVDEDLKSLDEAKRKAAEQKVREEFYMSQEDFEHLVTVKSRPEPSEEELDTLFEILTSAHKRKIRNDNWALEEQGLTYWRVLKARLPLWRTTLDRRARWQRSLSQRNRTPIIDPDVVGVEDIRHPDPHKDPADKLRVDRWQWIEERLVEQKNFLEGHNFRSWGSQGTENGQFTSPNSLALDGFGNVYVSDSSNNRIQKFTSDGTFIKAWGILGRADGQFNYPYGIAIDNADSVFVADCRNHRIQKFDSDGTFLSTWGSRGNGDGELNSPNGLTIDDEGNIYVTDKHRISRFTLGGDFISAWGSEGSQNGKFKSPSGITVDHSGNVYVADSGNHRIQKFSSNGEFLEAWGEAGGADGQFRLPTDVAIDNNDNLFVTDTRNRRIQKFDRHGKFLRAWGTTGNELGQFMSPRGLALDAAGDVYVADTGNDRIQVFSPKPLLNKLVRNVLGVDLQDLSSLADEYEKGNDISKRLDQLCLSMEALLHLMRVRELLDSDTEVMACEWDDVYSMLVQVLKRRVFADWRARERLDGITLSPDFFQLAKEEPVLPKWRASRETRWDWRDRLKQRMDQEQTTITAVAESVDASEESTLILLRDPLVEVCYDLLSDDNEKPKLLEKAKVLSEKLLIDFQIDTCQKTTRVSQALTTLQNLIFSLRTGQLEGLDLRLVDDEYFDEEWTWIGSYATWKAAVGIFLYPENLLLPTLRRRKSWGIQSLIKALREKRYLTPKMTSEAVRIYWDYFADVCNLTLAAAVQTSISVSGDPDSQMNSTEEHQIIYLFGQGARTGMVYFSTYDLNTQEQSSWIPVPGLSDVGEVIGAIVYASSSKGRSIFLFVQVQSGSVPKLVFTNFNLGTLDWTGPTNLEVLPDETPDNFQAVVKESHGEKEPPQLAILVRERIYGRSFNPDGTGWADEDPRVIAEYTAISKLQAMIGFGSYPHASYLFVTRFISGTESVFFGRVGQTGVCLWHSLEGKVKDSEVLISADSWVGAIVWPDSDVVYALCGSKEQLEKKYCIEIRNPTYSPEKIISSIGDFEGWLNSWYELSLTNKNPDLENVTVEVEVIEITYGKITRRIDTYDITAENFNTMDGLSFLNLDPENTALNLCYNDIPKVYLGSTIEEGRKLERWGKPLHPHWEASVKKFGEQLQIDEAWKAVHEKLLQCTHMSLSDVLLSLATQSKSFALLEDESVETTAYELDEGPESVLTAQVSESTNGAVSLFLATKMETNARIGNYRAVYQPDDKSGGLETQAFSRLAPHITASMEITKHDGDVALEILREANEEAMNEAKEQECPASVSAYLEETFYAVPLAAAFQLQRSGQYTAALDWFRDVYDYSRDVDERKIYYGLRLEEDSDIGYERSDEWLLDPLDIHAIASSRKNSYTRFTLISIIRCFLAYADAEFTCDTAESVTRARILYETALELLELDELNQRLGWCGQIIGHLEIEIEDPQWQGVWTNVLKDMARIKSMTVLKRTIDKIRDIMKGPGELPGRIAKAKQIVHEALSEPALPTIAGILDMRSKTIEGLSRILLENESIENGIVKAVLLSETAKKLMPISGGQATATNPSVAGISYYPNVTTFSYCIPPNPMIRALRFHTEINLHKLRTCRNIAGVKREIEAYAAPTDILSAMPAIGPGGQLVLPTKITPPPVPYRYEFLIERAKQLANMAAQMEAAVLSALEKRDIKSYNLLKARQDVSLARAGVKLQNLRLRRAHDEVTLAEFQQESAQIQADTYQEWIEAGLNKWELRMIEAYHNAAAARILSAFFDAGVSMHQAAAAVDSTGVGAPAAFMAALMATGRYMSSSMAIVSETQARVAAIWAGYERRKQEWQLQSELAQQSIRIGSQQIKIANDGVNIVRQEVNIAQIQVDHAEDTVEFLRNKFTNVELYDWMSRVLEEVYSYFLQQATSMAKLAQNQLAFERQETPPAFIQYDYWEVPSEDSIGGATEDSIDRHGLTGSARLLADIYKLDQYRIETEKRKLQLTKSISLARTAPYEFQRFKQTGVMVFATPMELFDRDFPGHYLRMIKQLRTSVVALIPPTHGIKATLTTIGISRLAVIRNYLFQTITAHRPPESVALTSPNNATGLFDLQAQPQMMLPFEGLGVDTVWEFRMPKAANAFDYNTIADIIVTIEYTALNSPDYRQQVIDTLPPTRSGNRPFSFRHQFPDAWYHLHNPDQTGMTVSFKTRREDFPPNIERLKIDQVLLYFASATDEPIEITATLLFKLHGEEPALGGEATTVDGMISTRRSAWPLLPGVSVIGEWTLVLPNTPRIQTLFKDEKIEDILFVITYSGLTPKWPK